MELIFCGGKIRKGWVVYRVLVCVPFSILPAVSLRAFETCLSLFRPGMASAQTQVHVPTALNSFSFEEGEFLAEEEPILIVPNCTIKKLSFIEVTVLEASDRTTRRAE